VPSCSSLYAEQLFLLLAPTRVLLDVYPGIQMLPTLS
jgi:hypothetical protein